MHPRPIARKCGFLLWSVSPHICSCGSIGQLLWLMALMLGGWKPIHHVEKRIGEGRTRREWKGKSRRRWKKKNNSTTVPHIFKRLFITVVYCQTPCLCISGGFKLMPNSFMSLDMEKWPLMKSYRQTVGNQRHMNLLCSMPAKTFLAKSGSVHLMMIADPDYTVLFQRRLFRLKKQTIIRGNNYLTFNMVVFVFGHHKMSQTSLVVVYGRWSRPDVTFKK